MKIISRALIMALILVSSVFTIAFSARAGYDHNDVLQNLHSEIHDVRIMTYVTNIGWTGPYYEGDLAGTTDYSKALEAISINVFDGTRIKYRVYMNGLGWSDWVENGDKVGATDEGKAITAIEIMTNEDGSRLLYQVCIEDIGWTDWIEENGGTAGVFNKKIEAIRLKLDNSIEEL